MKTTNSIFNALNFFFSLAAIATLVSFHGFNFQVENLGGQLIFLHACFGFYLLQFYFRAAESGDFRDYLRRNRAEYFLFFALIALVAVNWLLDFSILRWILSFTGISEVDHLYVLTLHVWLLLIVGIELGRVTMSSTIWRLTPPTLFILSFLVMTVIGSSLLMLPEMTVDGKGLSFIDAFFTSVSANCVTGLIVVDTATFFTYKGHFILLLLIQAGGLNIIFFATFFVSRYHDVLTGRHEDNVIAELLHTSEIDGDNTKDLLRRVVATSVLIEFIGMLVIYNQWGPEAQFEQEGDGIFYALFHSVSAFNNAGFSLFTGGLKHAMVVNNSALHISMALLILVGGIGFTTIWDLTRFKSLFKRGEPASPFKLDTKVSVFGSLALLVLGMTLFYFFERNGAMNGMGDNAALVGAFFQSVTARTAGFDTIDMANMALPTVILMIFLMFIGASSGSTGGGVKTSTLSVLMIALARQVPGGDREHERRLVSQAMINKAILISGLAFGVITLGSFGLLFFEPEMHWADLVFEEVSAFGTVGLSRGITADLSSTGKSIVMITMLIGRVGPLTIAYALIRNERFHESTRIEGFMIG